MIQLSDKNITVYLCRFKATLSNASILIKFPCQYFIQWKCLNGKVLATSKKFPSAVGSTVDFKNQTLNIDTQMLYDDDRSVFFKKDTLLTINLISKSRPDQVKLVGRVNVDLSQMTNNETNLYSEFATSKLTYCSVNADVTFKAQVLSKRLTEIQPGHLDKSAFNDFFTFNSLSDVKLNLGEQNRKPLPEYKQYPIKQHTSFPGLVGSNKEEMSTKINQGTGLFGQSDHQRQSVLKNDDNMEQTRSVSPLKKNIGSTKANESLFYRENQWEPEKEKLTKEIELNKNKINYLEKKIQDLCRNLDSTKQQNEARNLQSEQKERLIKELRNSEKRVREDYLKLQQTQRLSQENVEQKPRNSIIDNAPPYNPAVQSTSALHYESHHDIPITHSSIPLSPRNQQQNFFNSQISAQLYNQKISEILQAKRLLQENEYIIKQHEFDKKELEKKINADRNEFLNEERSWKEKRIQFEATIKALQSQNKGLEMQIKSLRLLQTKLQKSHEEVQKLRNLQKDAQNELNRLKGEVKKSEVKQKEMSSELVQRQKNIQELKSLNRQLQYEKKSTLKDLESLEASLKKKSQECEDFQAQMNVLSIAKQEKDNKINALNIQIEEQTQVSRNQLMKAQQKNQQLIKQIENLNALIRQSEKEAHKTQYIEQINENLQKQIRDIQKTMAQKDKLILEMEEKDLGQKSSIQALESEKKQLLIKNQSFQQQIVKIEGLLQDSFHKKDSENQAKIEKLQEEIRVSNVEYEQVLKEKEELSEELERQFEEKENQILRLTQEVKNKGQKIESLKESVQTLKEVIEDKLSIIKMFQVELDNRKQINDKFQEKLQKMDRKQVEMQETIEVLEQESKKVMVIIEEKQRADQYIEELKRDIEQCEALNKELQEEFEFVQNSKYEIEDRLKHEEEINLQSRYALEQSETVMENFAEEFRKVNQKYKESERLIVELEATVKQLQGDVYGKNGEIFRLKQELSQRLIGGQTHQEIQKMSKMNSTVEEEKKIKKQLTLCIQQIRAYELKFQEMDRFMKSLQQENEHLIAKLNERNPDSEPSLQKNYTYSPQSESQQKSHSNLKEQLGYSKNDLGSLGLGTQKLISISEGCLSDDPSANGSVPQRSHNEHQLTPLKASQPVERIQAQNINQNAINNILISEQQIRISGSSAFLPMQTFCVNCIELKEQIRKLKLATQEDQLKFRYSLSNSHQNDNDEFLSSQRNRNQIDQMIASECKKDNNLGVVTTGDRLVKFKKTNSSDLDPEVRKESIHYSETRNLQQEQPPSMSENIQFTSDELQEPKLQVERLLNLLRVKNTVISQLTERQRYLTNKLNHARMIYTPRSETQSPPKVIINQTGNIVRQSTTNVYSPRSRSVQKQQKGESIKEETSLKKQIRHQEVSDQRIPSVVLSSPKNETKAVADQSPQNTEKKSATVENQQLNSEDRKLNRRLKLLGLQNTTLRSLRKENQLQSLQLRPIKSHSNILQSKEPSQFGDGSEFQLNEESNVHWMNVSNAANKNSRSYLIIKNVSSSNNSFSEINVSHSPQIVKNLNKIPEQSEKTDKKTNQFGVIEKNSPLKSSKIEEIKEKRYLLQRKYNMGCFNKGIAKIIPKFSNQADTPNTIIVPEQTHNNHSNILGNSSLQNTGTFSVANVNPTTSHTVTFLVTVEDLQQKVSELTEALEIVEDQKRFLQNQIEMLEQEKFYIGSDLNEKQIEVYELYKANLAFRQEIFDLKFENEHYLRMISSYEKSIESAHTHVHKVGRQTNEYQAKNQEQNKISSSQHNPSQFSNIIRPSVYQPEQSQSNFNPSNISVSHISHKPEPKSDHNLSDYVILKDDQKNRNSQIDPKFSEPRFSTIFERINNYEENYEKEIERQKQNKLLQEEIHSKQQILIDQNGRLYEQQLAIKLLNQKILQLQNQLEKHSLQTQQQNQTSGQRQKENKNIPFGEQKTVLEERLGYLWQENQNLRQQIEFQGNEIDRLNGEISHLHHILEEKHQEINYFRGLVDRINHEHRLVDQDRMNVIFELQRKTVGLQQSLEHLSNNPNSNGAIDPSLKQSLYEALVDVSEELRNLRDNVREILMNSVSCIKESNEGYIKDDSHRKEFLMCLLDSMDNNLKRVIEKSQQTGV